MGKWKAWKSKAGKAIKKFLIYVGIAIGAIILLAILYRVGIGLYKSRLTSQIGKLRGQLSVQNSIK
jgi:hypothetical protein